MAQTEARSTLTYITFGVQYRRAGQWANPHPIAKWADCNGYLTVVAPTREDARRATMELLDRHWAFDYDTPPKPFHAPLGELARLVVQDDGGTLLVVKDWVESPAEPDLEAMSVAINNQTYRGAEWRS